MTNTPEEIEQLRIIKSWHPELIIYNDHGGCWQWSFRGLRSFELWGGTDGFFSILDALSHHASWMCAEGDKLLDKLFPDYPDSREN